MFTGGDAINDKSVDEAAREPHTDARSRHGVSSHGRGYRVVKGPVQVGEGHVHQHTSNGHPFHAQMVPAASDSAAADPEVEPERCLDKAMASGDPKDIGGPPLPAPSPLSLRPAFYVRLVVVFVLVAIAAVAVLALTVARLLAPLETYGSIEQTEIGPWSILVSDTQPPSQVVTGVLLVLGAIVVTTIVLEALTTLTALSPNRRYLEMLRGDEPPPVSGRRLRVTVLIPAHNEQDRLGATLDALANQSRKPDRVIVIADNCTDGTAQIAGGHGHEVFETTNNTEKKGGALNQALERLLPVMGREDLVLVMDADTTLGEDFIAVGARSLEDDTELGAVGGLFSGESGHGVLGQFQRNEYTRYGTQIRQRRGRVFVLTGTASMFRATLLLDVAAARGVFLPGPPGQVYDTAALTEDNELTLALKVLGAPMLSPRECTVTTELMPTWGDLWRQRQRWQRGALENLGAYGFRAATLRYWGQQFGIGYGTVALVSALTLMGMTALALDQWVWFPFWLAVGSVFWLERVATAWRGGWRARLLAITLFPEIAYDLFLQAVFVNSLWRIGANREARWNHVGQGAAT